MCLEFIQRAQKLLFFILVCSIWHALFWTKSRGMHSFSRQIDGAWSRRRRSNWHVCLRHCAPNRLIVFSYECTWDEGCTLMSIAGKHFSPSQKQKPLARVHPLLTRTSPFLVKNDWCAGGSFHFFSGPCEGGGGPVSSGKRGRRHRPNEPTTHAPPTAKSTTEKWGCLSEFLRGIFTNEGWRAHPREEIHDGRRFLLT